ncbi:MAG: DoxX family protein [Acidobacteria bacterium]|nr:DoxX family protein [Acidobacteriota bacterium]
MFTQVLSKWNVVALTLLRIVTGFLFWQHGAQKMFGVLGGRAVEFPQLVWFAGVLEFYGGIAIALGLFTRPVAFVLAGEMACAYFISHFPRGFWPIQNQGERAALFCFIYLLLATTGGGRLELSSLFAKKRS